MPNQYSNKTARVQTLLDFIKIDTDECQEWPFAHDRKGYGSVSYQGERYQTHRLVIKLTDPDFDESLHALHHCDNPPCCNKKHLFQGTNADNQADMDKKGRRSTPPVNRGGAQHLAKLTEDQVREIRNIRNSQKIPFRKLAERYGVTGGTIWQVVVGNHWKHVI